MNKSDISTHVKPFISNSKNMFIPDNLYRHFIEFTSIKVEVSKYLGKQIIHY